MVRELNFAPEIFERRAGEFLLKSEDKDHVNSDRLMKDLEDTLSTMEDRVYLCANEIGFGLRAFTVKNGDNFKTFFNPVIHQKDNFKLIIEVDPSDGNRYLRLRPTNVILDFLTEEGKQQALKFDESGSVIIAQAMECLEGVHDKDLGLLIDEQYDNATDEEREEVNKYYIEQLLKLNKKLDEDLMSDEEVKDFWEGYKFNLAKATGQVEIESEDSSTKLNRRQRRLIDRLNKKLGKKHK